MSEYEKRLFAAYNSQHFLKDSFDYGGVDGRVYQTETQPEAPAKLNYDRINDLQRAENMSLKELFQVENFLRDGTMNKKLLPKEKDKVRMLEEYPIAKNPKTHTFQGDTDKVWSVLKSKFPEATAPFKNYKACQYAVRYGAIEQIAWQRAEERNIQPWSPPESIAKEIAKEFGKDAQEVAKGKGKGDSEPER